MKILQNECLDLVEYKVVICHHITGMGTNKINEWGQKLQEQISGWRQSTDQNGMPIVNKEIQQSKSKKEILQWMANWLFHTSVNIIELDHDG